MVNFNPIRTTKLGFKIWLLDFVTETLGKPGEKWIISQPLTRIYFGATSLPIKTQWLLEPDYGRLIGVLPLSLFFFI